VVYTKCQFFLANQLVGMDHSMEAPTALKSRRVKNTRRKKESILDIVDVVRRTNFIPSLRHCCENCGVVHVLFSQSIVGSMAHRGRGSI
jgi:hypothetical protein